MWSLAAPVLTDLIGRTDYRWGQMEDNVKNVNNE
jgi:hypothetical protein